MDFQIILLIILSVSFLVILIIGILLKRYTKRKLNDIDGFQGIIKQKDIIGKSVAVEIKNIDDRKNEI